MCIRDRYLTLPADEFIAQTGETGALKTAFNAEESAIPAIQAVSYTHLDVYKRQVYRCQNRGGEAVKSDDNAFCLRCIIDSKAVVDRLFSERIVLKNEESGKYKSYNFRR